MSAEFASLLVTTIIGFLTLIVQNAFAGRKASSERKDAADALKLQFDQAREDLKLKATLDAEREKRNDERAERDRKWAVEDRITAATMKVQLESVARKADAAYVAATNIGTGLEDDPVPPPVPSRRLAALAAQPVAKKPAPVKVEEEPMANLNEMQLFPPGHE